MTLPQASCSFIANLLSNHRPGAILWRCTAGSRAAKRLFGGLASGVEAVTHNNPGGAKIKWRPLAAILTVLAYVVGGIAAALLLRAMSGYV